MSALINAMTPQPELIINTDGGSRGNPGHSAVGVVITTPDGQHLESFGRYIGVTTNNQAEYTAVLDGLEAAAKYQPRKLQFLLDSELVVKQLKGEYRVKNAELQPLHAQIRQQIEGMDVSFGHVLRAKNRLADIEVNRALDAQLAA
jgi:ribonuclease HI